MDLDRIEAVIEAVLFTMGDSVEVEKLAAAIEHDVDTTWIDMRPQTGE